MSFLSLDPSSVIAFFNGVSGEAICLVVKVKNVRLQEKLYCGCLISSVSLFSFCYLSLSVNKWSEEAIYLVVMVENGRL